MVFVVPRGLQRDANAMARADLCAVSCPRLCSCMGTAGSCAASRLRPFVRTRHAQRPISLPQQQLHEPRARLLWCYMRRSVARHCQRDGRAPRLRKLLPGLLQPPGRAGAAVPPMEQLPTGLAGCGRGHCHAGCALRAMSCGARRRRHQLLQLPAWRLHASGVGRRLRRLRLCGRFHGS